MSPKFWPFLFLFFPLSGKKMRRRLYTRALSAELKSTDSRFYAVPTLGPMQMIEQMTLRALSPCGSVAENPTLRWAQRDHGTNHCSVFSFSDGTIGVFRNYATLHTYDTAAGTIVCKNSFDFKPDVVRQFCAVGDDDTLFYSNYPREVVLYHTIASTELKSIHLNSSLSPLMISIMHRTMDGDFFGEEAMGTDLMLHRFSSEGQHTTSLAGYPLGYVTSRADDVTAALQKDYVQLYRADFTPTHKIPVCIPSCVYSYQTKDMDASHVLCLMDWDMDFIRRFQLFPTFKELPLIDAGEARTSPSFCITRAGGIAVSTIDNVFYYE
jgi:hypothetical protein